MIPENSFQVLDKGYCRLVDKLGTDLTPVNAARVSYNKQSFTLNEKDAKLISFLAKHDHTSPFRHAMLQFEIYVPLMVARQHWKYIVGSSMQDNMLAWNESSRRYITEEPEFYVPGPRDWRMAPENSKQGSGENFSSTTGKEWTESLEDYIREGERLYNSALKKGIAPEQARLFLPAYGMYVRYYWTGSLAGVCHFLNQRLEHSAQVEIQELAHAVAKHTKEAFPVSYEALVQS